MNHPSTDQSFKKWVGKQSGVFLFFCSAHVKQAMTKHDVETGTHEKKAKCDWPGCRLKATHEFFPGLGKEIKKYEKENRSRKKTTH